MSKFFFALLLTIATSVFAVAQSDDYNKGEFFIGYSNGQVDTGIDSGDSVNSFLRDRTNFHGFNVSGVYNVSRYAGIKADVSGTYNSTRFTFPVTTGTTTQNVSFDTKNALYNVVGGIQIKDNGTAGRVKPFAHAMIGAGHGRTNVENVNCTTTTTFNCGNIANASETGLAGVFGGGLDIRINDRIDFRAFQVDYNPIKFDAGTDHNVRFGIGIVIK
jgi:hypothetical protein